MAEPHIFFSTLAQATAALVGFIIAVACALYSLERQRVERRTENYRDALIEFRNRYGFAIEILSNMLQNEDIEPLEEVTDMSVSRDELSKLAYEDSEKYPVSTLLLTHISRILYLLNQIEPSNDNLLSFSQLQALQDSIVWYYEHFSQLDETSETLIEELTGNPYTEFDTLPGIQLFGQSMLMTGFSAFQLEGWFKQRKQIESDFLRPEIGDSDEESTISEEFLTGDSFWTLSTLSGYLMSDFRNVSRESAGTIINYDAGIRPVIKLSTYLLLIGVFIPVGMLLTTSVTAPAEVVVLVQILLLGVAVLLSLALVEITIRSAEPTTRMGNKENLSQYSKWILTILPELPR